MDKCNSGYYGDTTTGNCLSCISNCNNCTTSSNCFKCKAGYVLDTTTTTCVSSCPTGYYANANDVCQSCISNCNVCSNKISCTTCATSYLLLNNGASSLTCISGTTCPTGYYINSQTCNSCLAQCLTCTGPSTCTSCVTGYYLSASKCLLKCGDGTRQDNEECDDGNGVSGDGCSNKCKVETG